MNVISLPFLAFAGAVALLHGASGHAVWRRLVMLVANVAFVLSFTRSPHALVPLAGFLLLGYCAVLASRYTRTALSTVLLGATFISAFCWLKHYWFLSFLPSLPWFYVTIGLSYAFFRILGLALDARQEPSLAYVGPVSFLNFAVNFPTFVAGPIDRYQNFAEPDRPVTFDVTGHALQRISLGAFKVLALSVLVQRWQTAATAALLMQHSRVDGWKYAVLSFGLYPVFLYFNFSGYTDLVIGVGQLLGKRYPENFDAPFRSYNLIEFWSRWHMSLSFWLRDYLYTPLLKRSMQMGLSTSADPYLGVLCLLLTFFVIGVWHGSTAIFAVYGLVLGLGVSVNKLYQVMQTRRLGRKGYRELTERVWYRMVCRGLTYTYYCFCMLCFWNTGPSALHLWRGLHLGGMLVVFLLLLVATTVLLNAFQAARTMLGARLRMESFGAFAPHVRAVGVGLLLFGCIASAVLTQQVNPQIIYQAF